MTVPIGNLTAQWTDNTISYNALSISVNSIATPESNSKLFRAGVNGTDIFVIKYTNQGSKANVGIGLSNPIFPIHIENPDSLILAFDNDGAMSNSRPGWVIGPRASDFHILRLSSREG